MKRRGSFPDLRPRLRPCTEEYMHGSQPNVCFIGLSHSCIDSVASAPSIMYVSNIYLHTCTGLFIAETVFFIRFIVFDASSVFAMICVLC